MGSVFSLAAIAWSGENLVAFITFRGSYPTNPLSSIDYHLLLAHPAVVDTLILREHQDKPYARLRSGWPVSGERSLTGALTINGNINKLAQEFDCNFLVRRPQWQLFDRFLAAQQDAPCTLLDRFNGETDSLLVWLQVDSQYRTPAVMGEWWTLQFRALEEK
jgi:hypothetical protein